MKGLCTLSFVLAFAAVAPDAIAAEADPRVALAARLPGVDAADLEPSAIPGLWEVRLGPRIVYVTSDGRYLLQGRLLDLKTESDMTELAQHDARLEWMSGIDESDMIVFEPPGATIHTITIFTDIDCSYCRALHANINRMLKDGIRVRYLLFPRNGPDTPSAEKAVRVWCSKDRRAALTRAKAGQTVESPDCGESPVGRTLELARELGVSATPTILTDSGTIISGYEPPAQMLEKLESHRELRRARVSR